MKQPLLTALLLLSLVGCTLNTDYFKEYRDVNLLGNYGFDAVETDGTTPKWALEPTAPASDFMTWEDAGQSGPDGVSPAYRLEIKNLIPAGDFEGSGTLGAFWTVPSGATATLSTGLSTALPTRALDWNGGDPSNVLQLDLSSAAGASWRAGLSYRFRMNFVNTSSNSTFFLSLVDGTGAALSVSQADNAGVWDLSDVSDTAVHGISNQFYVEATTDTRTLQVGATNKTSQAYLDNVRLLPDNESLSVKAALPRLNSGTLKLLPGQKKGMYSFTLKVKDDPTAGADNRFHPTHLTVRLNAAVGSGSGVASESFERPSTGWTSWTTITLKFGFDFVSTNAELTGDALTLEISPTLIGTDAVDVGSVLIAEPILTYNP